MIIGELAPIGAIGKTAGNLAPLAFIRQMWCRDDKLASDPRRGMRALHAAQGRRVRLPPVPGA